MQRQYYGIKFPFTNNNEQCYYTDLNITTKDKVRSDLLHLVLTPKGQKLRDPNYGTDLIKFIYEQNDNETWNGISNEIKKCVSKYMPYVILNEVNVAQDTNDEFSVYVKLDFSVKQGNSLVNDSIAVNI